MVPYFLQTKGPVLCIQDCQYQKVIISDQKSFENFGSIARKIPDSQNWVEYFVLKNFVSKKIYYAMLFYEEH